MPGVGTTEMLLVLATVLLLFGAKRIPDLARSLGSGVRECRKGASVQDKNAEAENSGVRAGLPEVRMAQDEAVERSVAVERKP